MTYTLQIGNSDDKLTQKEWSEFVEAVNDLVKKFARKIWFFGAPPNFAEWQNAAWVFAADNEDAGYIRHKVGIIRAMYQQDSVAWTVGETALV